MDYLTDLNPAQQKAVTAPAGPILVLAGPGSGKTRVLTHRIAYQVDQLAAAAQAIMAVTFTNKASREMIARLQSLSSTPEFGGLAPRGLQIGTFHSLCARILRREADHLPITHEFVIFDDADQRSLLRQIYKELNLDPKQIQPRRVHDMISRAKNELVDVKTFTIESYLQEITHRVFTRYQQLLLANNALDFDDLLQYVVTLLKNNPQVRARYQGSVKHILVDEFQDTNTAQYALLRLLSRGSARSFCSRRSGSIDLPLARGRLPQCPAFSGGFPRRTYNIARAELPLHSDHPRRGHGGDRSKYRPPEENPGDRQGYGPASHAA